MQVSLLSNYCLFHTVMSSLDCYKMLSQLNTLSFTTLPNKQLRYSLYETRKDLKNVFKSKQKKLPNQFQMIVIEDGSHCFVYNREKNAQMGGKDGHMAIASKSFIQLMNNNKVFGERTLIKSTNIIFQVIKWENFIFFHSELPNSKTIVLIQQIFGSTVIPGLNEQLQTSKKIKMLFEPLLQLLIGVDRSKRDVQEYCKQLLRIKALHPEVMRQINKDGDKQKLLIQINFCLVFYYALIAAQKQNCN